MNGYAVFDIETTGFRLHPDSIVEIAVVHVDAAGEITGAWDTLLHPRDGEVGPTRVHGVTRAMISEAPAFAEVADQLHALFEGRIPVAHRIAQFDGRFLNAHFTWAGIDTDAFTQGLCTWQLASRHLPLAHHTLGDCCDHLGIDLSDAHQALTDTVATAQLLGHFIRAGQCAEILARATAVTSQASGSATSLTSLRPRRALAAAARSPPGTEGLAGLPYFPCPSSRQPARADGPGQEALLLQVPPVDPREDALERFGRLGHGAASAVRDQVYLGVPAAFEHEGVVLGDVHVVRAVDHEHRRVEVLAEQRTQAERRKALDQVRVVRRAGEAQGVADDVGIQKHGIWMRGHERSFCRSRPPPRTPL